MKKIMLLMLVWLMGCAVERVDQVESDLRANSCYCNGSLSCCDYVDSSGNVSTICSGESKDCCPSNCEWTGSKCGICDPWSPATPPMTTLSAPSEPPATLTASDSPTTDPDPLMMNGSCECSGEYVCCPVWDGEFYVWDCKYSERCACSSQGSWCHMTVGGCVCLDE